VSGRTMRLGNNFLDCLRNPAVQLNATAQWKHFSASPLYTNSSTVLLSHYNNIAQYLFLL